MKRRASTALTKATSKRQRSLGQPQLTGQPGADMLAFSCIVGYISPTQQVGLARVNCFFRDNSHHINTVVIPAKCCLRDLECFLERYRFNLTLNCSVANSALKLDLMQRLVHVGRNRQTAVNLAKTMTFYDGDNEVALPFHLTNV